ncbi:MAG TPA: hypothetical protein PK156_49410, partial [Polyangium sp.]|nr:hypothetical protein [Polyangium sp.]
TLAVNQDSLAGLALTNAELVWTTKTSPGNVMHLKLPDSAPEVVASGENMPNGVAVNAGFVFWTNQGDGTVKSVSLAGGVPATLATSQGNPTRIVVDDTWAYWTSVGANAVRKVKRAGGSFISVAAQQEMPSGLAIQENELYWTNGGSGDTGSVAMVNLVTAISAEIATIGQPMRIALDAEYAYWTDPSDGKVFRAPRHGGKAEILASGQVSPFGIAVDEHAIYWTCYAPQGVVMRLAKP